MTINIVLFALLSYFIGSIPTALWVGKIFRNIDVRDYGSKSSGTTNTFRVLGIKFAIPVLIIDIFKGYGVTLFVFLCTVHPDTPEFTYYKVIFGLFAVAGHVFPVYAGFRGGKGIATLAGLMAGISFPAILICLFIFLVAFLITRYVSASSIMASFSLPFSFLIFFGKDIVLLIFALIIIIIVLFTHRKNIERLIKGEENKIRFSKKEK